MSDRSSSIKGIFSHGLELGKAGLSALTYVPRTMVLISRAKAARAQKSDSTMKVTALERLILLRKANIVTEEEFRIKEALLTQRPQLPHIR